ncbi:E3 ubiquitin-protein ligase RMA1H1 [Platanthera zijinensis]|uniref:E3 ubiquitin-protein ligase RMA1H1 n=1 Tax=Platanthera zijinensis TaxID=2320716 RepID=A0AAP0G8G2_9ASPA
MSISPTDAQRSFSNPSTSDPARTHSSGHGSLPPQQVSGFLGPQINGPSSTPFGSAQSSAKEPSDGFPVEISGTDHGSFHYFSGAPQNVRDTKGSNARKHSSGQNTGTYSQHQLFDQKGSSPQLRSIKLDQQPNLRLVSGVNMLCDNHWPLDSTDTQITATQATSRRREVMNANHLLNFHYDPIPRSRAQQRIPPPRRQQQRIKPYNKGLFLQANYKFVIYDTGRYSAESIDPDKMLPWEDVICVRYSSPISVLCPICLESPLCPQITSCGHIYCFPCILRYLLTGVEEQKIESWKKCPLCFSMISSKDLYTIEIENVKQLHVCDHADFALLARAKDSLIPSFRSQDGTSFMPRSSNKTFDLFSKFILSSDIELSVRDAKTSLADWLSKAEMGIVDDMEKLPYVCAALEQLEERIKKWVENRALNGGPLQSNRFVVSSSHKVVDNSNSSNACLLNSNLDTEHTHSDAWMGGSPENRQIHTNFEFSENFSRRSTNTPGSFSELMYDEEKALKNDSSSCKDIRERDSYSFYQAVDGQPLILHPLSMKCLLHHYGSYDMLPPRISGAILELETITQSEATRKRYRYLSHFSLTTVFQLCEIELTALLPPASLAPFMDEIKKREKHRKQLVKKERDDRARTDAIHTTEVAALRKTLNPTNQRYLSNKDTIFSLDEFEALGSGAVPSTNPSMNSERKLFSSVTRLGYAAAYDSPALRDEESAISSRCMDAMQEASGSQATRTIATPSFVNILSSAKNEESAETPKLNAISKKGKKLNRVLLSTSGGGGRRY